MAAASFVSCSDSVGIGMSRLNILSFVLVLLALSATAPSSALFQASSGPRGALSAQEGTDVYVALSNLLGNFNTSRWYDSGVSFANLQSVNGKRIVIRYTRWTQYCTVGTWESAIGSLVLEDFRTTVPYLRPYLLQGCSWAAVSNGYAWIDFYVHDADLNMQLPSDQLHQYNMINVSNSTTVNTNTNDNAVTNDAAPISASGPLSSSRFLMSSTSLSRFSPVDKTGFVDCPVLPLILLSHLNGIWDVLKAGEYLTSANKRIQLAMQKDCNLVLTDTQNSKRVLWISNTAGRGSNCFLRLQTEANLVIYTGDGVPVWAINQGCGSGCEKFSSLVIEDDGNLVLFRSENNKLNKVWATNTKV